MNTTEWVGRYNHAFREAAASAAVDADCAHLDKLVDAAMLRAANKICGTNYPDWESVPTDPNAGNVFKPIPPNPSPFEPKEVVDDGQEGIGALNRKE